MLLGILLFAPFRPQLLLGGDVMLNAIAPNPAVFADVAPYVRSAELALANLEIPLTDERTPTSRKTREEVQRRDQFILKAHPGHGKFLAEAGFDLVSLANNHAMDYRYAGLQQMQGQLEAAGINFAGAGEDRESARRGTVRMLADGTRVGMISAMAFVTSGALSKTTPATDSDPGVHALNYGGTVDEAARTDLEEWISEAHNECDILVVALHWGVERKTVPNSYQVALGRAIIECGADVVWGNHPHVLQGAELYRGKPILYSMGNLISPLPAQTAFMGLSRVEGEWQAQLLPAGIAGGRVYPVRGRAGLVAEDRFRSLCDAIQAKFPDPESVALPIR